MAATSPDPTASTLPPIPPLPLPTPPTKRKRPTPSALSRSSHLFHPYRSIGHIIGPHPFHLSTLGSTRLLHSITGRTFSIYNLDRIRTVLTSQPAPHPISCITAAGRDLTAVGAGRELVVYRRQEVVERVGGHGGAVYMVRQWGAHHLLTVDDTQTLRVWDMRLLHLTKQREVGPWELPLKTEADDPPPPTPPPPLFSMGEEEKEGATTQLHRACIATLDLRAFDLTASPSAPTQSLRLPSTSRLTCLVHPPTFVNKVLMAFSTGLLLLYNLHTRTPIHAYYPVQSFLTSHLTSLSSSSPTSPLLTPPPSSPPAPSITALTTSPSPGVISLGTSSGLILQFSLDSSTVLSAFHQHWGEVTSLSYRTDGWPHLLSGTKQGHLLTWHLGEWEEGGRGEEGEVGGGAGRWRRRPGFHSSTLWCQTPTPPPPTSTGPLAPSPPPPAKTTSPPTPPGPTPSASTPLTTATTPIAPTPSSSSSDGRRARPTPTHPSACAPTATPPHTTHSHVASPSARTGWARRGSSNAPSQTAQKGPRWRRRRSSCGRSRRRPALGGEEQGELGWGWG